MQKQTRKNFICSVLALLLALTALTALSYNIIYGTSDTFIIRAENGFSLMSFSSDMGGYTLQDLRIAIGVFCILQLPFSFFSLLFNILTIVMPNKAYRFTQNFFVYLNELFLFIYALCGIIAATNLSNAATAAYIPLLYGTVLLLAYIYCSKKLPEPQNEEPAAYKTN